MGPPFWSAHQIRRWLFRVLPVLPPMLYCKPSPAKVSCGASRTQLRSQGKQASDVKVARNLSHDTGVRIKTDNSVAPSSEAPSARHGHVQTSLDRTEAFPCLHPGRRYEHTHKSGRQSKLVLSLGLSHLGRPVEHLGSGGMASRSLRKQRPCRLDYSGTLEWPSRAAFCRHSTRGCATT